MVMIKMFEWNKSFFPLENYKIFKNCRVIYRFSILITIKEINISSINQCPRGKTERVASGSGNASGGGGTNVEDHRSMAAAHWDHSKFG